MAKLFTKVEDEIILSITTDAESEGIPLETAFIKLSDELDGRSPEAIGRRYRRLKNVGAIRNNRGSITQGELMVIKLKALAKERTRHNKKVDVFKERYLDMQRQYNQLSREHQLLQKEHQTLVDSVRSALGED